MLKIELDPWRVLRSFLSKINSREVPDIIDRAGLSVDWSLTEKQDYSHATRWSAYRPRIDAAYDALVSDDNRLRVAYIVAGEIARHGFEKELNEALTQIGWKLRGGSLVPAGSTVRELFFPDGSHHDAYVEIRGIIQNAANSVEIIDAYVDSSTLTLLTACAKSGTSFRVLTSKYPPDLALEAEKWRKQHIQNTLEIHITKEFHDRFIVLDGADCWHLGASIKDAGNKVFMITRVEDDNNRDALIQQIQKSWRKAGVL